MTFRDDFLKHIEKTTIYRLSKSTGIERTKLQRIKCGQKLPTREELEIICKELSLTPDERDAIFQELEIANIGEDKYKSRTYTKNFIEELYNIFNSEPQNEIITNIVNLNVEGTYTTANSSDTSALINNFISSEASKKNNIFIYNTSAVGNMFDNIYSKILNRPNLTVTQIIGIKPHDDSFENYYENIDIISKVYPVFLSDTDYHAYYYYDKVMENSMFPLTLVSDNYTLMISYDLKYAMLTDDKSIVDISKSVFNEKVSKSYSLINDITGLSDYTGIYIEHYKKYNNPRLISIEYEPCPFPYIEPDLIKQLVYNELAEYDEIIQRCIEIRDLYNKAKHNQLYFTKEGVLSFLKKGRIAEIPEIVYKPIPLNERINILHRLCYDAKVEKSKELHIIKDEKLKVPKNLRYCGQGQINDFLLLLPKKTGKLSIFKLNECGFAKPFYDFASHLCDTDMVLSNDESIEFIENCIKDRL